MEEANVYANSGVYKIHKIHDMAALYATCTRSKADKTLSASVVNATCNSKHTPAILRLHGEGSCFRLMALPKPAMRKKRKQTQAMRAVAAKEMSRTASP